MYNQTLSGEYKEANGRAYLRLNPESGAVGGEGDAVRVVELCARNGTRRVLFPEGAIGAAFFRLSPHGAGMLLGKLGNYHIKAAAVIDDTPKAKQFTAAAAEADSGECFRAWADEPRAVQWLLSGEDDLW